MSENNDRGEVQDQSLTITKTAQGRLTIQTPDDFLMVLGMLEWAKEHVWAMYKNQHAKAREAPKIQVPGMRVPPTGQN